MNYLKPAIYSFCFNIPIVFEAMEEIEEWMVYEDSFIPESFESIEGWMFGEEDNKINEDYSPVAEWMYRTDWTNETYDEGDNELYEWMYNFEEFVVTDLISSLEINLIDQWMYKIPSVINCDFNSVEQWMFKAVTIK
ncbi:hypothetical protein QA597_00365 [Marinilabiliaceae bacterium ANBcel2]|nr:hypothetical protein [Marinilabiliaceae bacterium ANBcel2]